MSDDEMRGRLLAVCMRLFGRPSMDPDAIDWAVEVLQGKDPAVPQD